nr:7-deoxyloganetin glucosyltransferase-like [Ziziphus jujuba var. spinosa]
MDQMGSRQEGDHKPHAICIALPIQSHIKALLKFAKLLHFKGFHITFVNTEFNHKRFLKSLGPNSLDGLPDFVFETIPDGLPPCDDDDDGDATQDIASLCESVRTNCLRPFLNKLTSCSPPVTCIVSDGFMSFTITAAEELGIPVALFFSIAACGFMGVKQYSALKEKGLSPLKDDRLLNNVIDWIPGMKDIRLKDLPSFFRGANPLEVTMFNFAREAADRAHKATAVVIQTFDALERDVLEAISSTIPHSYAIGPLQLLLDHIPEDHPGINVGYSLWKEDSECLQWLQTKPPNSVVYVNFGSTTVMTPQQLVEFGFGLANSNQPFLWIIRPDLVVGESAVLPAELADQIKEKGVIASWCPQEQVLNHPSVGGFLTHCGWNSIIESLSAGVPMLCWPFFAEQQTNCRYACKQWRVGMEIKNDSKRDEIEKLVRELMEGDKGKEMKSKALEWRKLAQESTAPNGSSSLNLDTLVDRMLRNT